MHSVSVIYLQVAKLAKEKDVFPGPTRQVRALWSILPYVQYFLRVVFFADIHVICLALS